MPLSSVPSLVRNMLTKESPISSCVSQSICSAAGFSKTILPFMPITITPSIRLVTISLYRSLCSHCSDICVISVSYTHLTLPTIYSV